MTAISFPDIPLVLTSQMANILLHVAAHQNVEATSWVLSMHAAPRPAKSTVTVLPPITVLGGLLQTHTA